MNQSHVPAFCFFTLTNLYRGEVQVAPRWSTGQDRSDSLIQATGVLRWLLSTAGYQSFGFQISPSQLLYLCFINTSISGRLPYLLIDFRHFLEQTPSIKQSFGTSHSSGLVSRIVSRTWSLSLGRHPMSLLWLSHPTLPPSPS